MSLRSGLLIVQANGNKFDLVGSFTLNLGQNKREGLIGPDGPHGHKAMPQFASIKGEVRDSSSLDVKNDVLNMEDATITAIVANDKTYMFEEAFYSGDGDIDTEEGKIQFEAQAISADELKPV